MERHQFMLDLLRTEFDVHDEFEGILCKRELTNNDLDLIIRNSETIALAAAKMKRVKQITN